MWTGGTRRARVSATRLLRGVMEAQPHQQATVLLLEPMQPFGGILGLVLARGARR